MRKCFMILLLLPLLVMGQIKGYWRLDGNANDVTGVNNGTAMNVTYAQGIINQCGQFSTSYVNCGTNSSLNFGTGSVTISAWVQTTNTTSYICICSKRHTGGSGFNCYVGANYAYADGGGTNGVFTGTAKAISDGLWHNIVFVYDRPGGKLRIYVDGVANGYTNFGSTTLNDTSPLLIGKTGMNTNDYFIGNIDIVIVYSTVLTPAQIKNQYALYKGFYQ